MMDLLKGYHSDGGSSSSSSSDREDENADATSSTTAVAAPRNPIPSFSVSGEPRKTKRAGGEGRRLLSLGAVLPPEIFDRLTRPPEEEDSSTSSFDGGDDGGDRHDRLPKKRRSRSVHGSKNDLGHTIQHGGDGDRNELNSLLSELRSTPLQEASTTKKKAAPPKIAKESDKLGMAFMSYSSSTTTSKKGGAVLDVHAGSPSGRPKSVTEPTATRLPVPGGGEKKRPLEPPAPPPAARSVPSLSRRCDSAPAVETSFKKSMPQYSRASPMQYPSAASCLDDCANPADEMATFAAEVTARKPSYGDSNTSTVAPKSRKQRREEERLLRSGAIQNSSATTTDICQPSPTEFAPTAHAAAVASRNARRQGIAAGGGGSVKNIAMYDPKAGADVKGLGVTGKHRSKHQINQLMASAISLEAHRASEAELARFGLGGGTGGKSTRADAKRKYGW